MSVSDHPLVRLILETWPGATIIMTEPNKAEIEAMLWAGNDGGAYLESLGKTDAATMDHDEWMGFIATVIHSFQGRFAVLMRPIDEDVPF